MFLKLMEMGGGMPLWINMDRVERMAIDAARGGTLLYYGSERCGAHVKESPEEIVALMFEFEQRLVRHKRNA